VRRQPHVSGQAPILLPGSPHYSMATVNADSSPSSIRSQAPRCFAPPVALGPAVAGVKAARGRTVGKEGGTAGADLASRTAQRHRAGNIGGALTDRSLRAKRRFLACGSADHRRRA
jgi:hypothetical protein